MSKYQNEMKVTNIEALKNYANGSIVELPEFGPGQPFVARLTRPSMVELMSEGKIPNSLLAVAEGLFTGKKNINMKESTIKDTLQVMQIIVELSLKEPTLKELNKAGLKLTDEQFIAIYNYSQQGINGLKSFRTKSQNTSNNSNVKNV